MTRRPRGLIVVVAVGHAAGTVLLALLFPRLGMPAGLFGLLAALVGALCFGLRGALLSSSIQVVLNIIVMQYVLFPPEEFSVASFLGIAAYFVFAGALGNQRDLSRKLKQELECNERLRVREQETLAAIPDVMVRVAPDGTCGLQGVKTSEAVAPVLERALGCALSSAQLATVDAQITRVRANRVADGCALEGPDATVHEARLLPAADGSVLIVLRDVSEQRRLLRRVTSAENLASLGTLAAGLAHEINNPLTYVITSISSAVRTLPPDETSVQEDLATALDGCWRIRDLVHNILENTTTGRDLVEPVFVPDVIESALTLVKSQVRHRAKLTWVPESVPYASAHRSKLVQVVLNLVVNASQAFADNHTAEHEIRVRAYGDDQHVLIEVSDNGPGMDETVKQRATEPFYTTKEPGQGSGLGLFLCCSIVESLGGNLQIDSQLGRGTKVTVRLPISDEAPASRIVSKGSPALVTELPPRFRVLIVDDEPEIRRALQRILSRKYVLSMCANGAEALHLLKAGDSFDVILCDILMPEMSGIEFFDELLRAVPEQAERVLFLTGGATSESARLFVQKHANRILHKPFKPIEVDAAVRNLTRFPIPIAPPSGISGAS